MAHKPKYYSFSRLKLYERCPRSYYYSYIKKLPQEESDAMAYGTEFHAWAEALHKKLNKEMMELQGVEVLKTFETDDKYKNKFLEWEAKRYLLLKEKGIPERFHPVLVEQKLIGKIAGIPILGYVDRVDLLANDKYAVIDYKTNPPWDDEGKKALKQQLVIYANLVEEIYDYDIKHIGCYFYKKGEYDLQLKYSSTQRAMENFVSRTVEKIENEGEWLPNINSHCNWCGFKNHCWELKDAF